MVSSPLTEAIVSAVCINAFRLGIKESQARYPYHRTNNRYWAEKSGGASGWEHRHVCVVILRKKSPTWMPRGFFQDLPSASGASWNVWLSELVSRVTCQCPSTRRKSTLECCHAILKEQRHWKSILLEISLVKWKQSSQRERSGWDGQAVFTGTGQGLSIYQQFKSADQFIR